MTDEEHMKAMQTATVEDTPEVSQAATMALS